jgi:hypothetical protein
MIHYPHNPEVKEFVLKQMRQGCTVQQIIDIAKVRNIGELQEEFVRSTMSDYLMPKYENPPPPPPPRKSTMKIEITEKELIELINLKVEIEQLNTWYHNNTKHLCLPVLEHQPFEMVKFTSVALVSLVEAIKSGQIVYIQKQRAVFASTDGWIDPSTLDSVIARNCK